MPFAWLLPTCSHIDEADVRQIVDAAVRIAGRVPWTVAAPDEFYDHLSAFGFTISGQKVGVTAAVIDKTIAAIEACRRSQPEVHARFAPSEVKFHTSGQAIWCSDTETGKLRPATKADQAAFSRLVNAFPGLGRTHPTFIPQDAPLRTREFHSFVTMMLNSDRPYRVSAYSPAVLPFFHRALAEYYASPEAGLEALSSDELCPAKVWINTPFAIARESLEAALLLRRMTGRPLTFGSMPVAGIATPVTPAGALALITAEVLGANAFALAVDGKPCGWRAGPCSFDMRTGIHAQWSPEVVLISTAGLHIGAYLFGGTPSVGFSNTTAAKTPGAQSMMERALGFGMGFQAGARWFSSLGILGTADIGSPVQLMLDMELAGALAKLAQGFAVDAESLAEEMIVALAPEGARFLDTEHTARHFRRAQWIPDLLDRRVPMAWVSDEREMLDNARAKALRLTAAAPNLCPLDDVRRRGLELLLAEADAELGRD
jgi:trimethylamine:corrinoid methyltransferase-like protein